MGCGCEEVKKVNEDIVKAYRNEKVVSKVISTLNIQLNPDCTSDMDCPVRHTCFHGKCVPVGG